MKRLFIAVVSIILMVSVTQTRACYQGYPTAGVTAHMSTILENSLKEEIPEISEDDIELLARLMTAEQGYSTNYTDIGEYEERLYLTGSVVINRINSDKFPNTLKEVVEQPGQYYCYECGSINKDYDDIAWEIAEELLVSGTCEPENLLWQSEFPQGDGIYKQIGNTYFCYSGEL